MQKIAQGLKRRNKTIGFVPTMGALHEGHLSLIRQANKENDIIVVSIFVNPIQFGPREDFSCYPRPLKEDRALCLKQKVDLLFYPTANQMYKMGFKTYVEVKDLSNVLCGVKRKGHFRGVATVVCKLFNIVQPDSAYFGQKDAQQAIIIQRMVKDLNIPIRIRLMPTVRQRNGLALSSRNLYLDKQERQDALCLSEALKRAKNLIKSGERNCQIIIKKLRELIESKKTARLEYVSIVDLENLKPMKKIKDKCLIALAVCIGKTRLIDNMVVKPD
jgi:pantoate--beta-alanine ligase